MKRLMFILLIIAGCAKESIHPVHNNFSLVGLWVSDDGKITYNIKNVTNQGTDEVYYEYSHNGGRFLRRTHFGYPTTWEVLRITEDQLTLSDMHGTVLYFWRAG